MRLQQFGESIDLQGVHFSSGDKRDHHSNSIHQLSLGRDFEERQVESIPPILPSWAIPTAGQDGIRPWVGGWVDAGGLKRGNLVATIPPHALAAKKNEVLGLIVSRLTVCLSYLLNFVRSNHFTIPISMAIFYWVWKWQSIPNLGVGCSLGGSWGEIVLVGSTIITSLGCFFWLHVCRILHHVKFNTSWLRVSRTWNLEMTAKGATRLTNKA